MMNVMQTAGKERRHSVRYPYGDMVYYGPAGRSAATAVDLSNEGICITTREPIEVGREIELLFFNRAVRVTGVVKNHLPLNSEQHRIGLGFHKPETELVEILLSGGNSHHG